jgi:hypothetical protein
MKTGPTSMIDHTSLSAPDVPAVVPVPSGAHCTAPDAEAGRRQQKCIRTFDKRLVILSSSIVEDDEVVMSTTATIRILLMIRNAAPLFRLRQLRVSARLIVWNELK